MSVQVDQGFLNAILGLFSSEQVKDEEELKFFEADCEMIETSLMVDANQTSESEQKHFYDNLHFSPLKVSEVYSMAFQPVQSISFELHRFKLRSVARLSYCMHSTITLCDTLHIFISDPDI